MYLSRCEYNAAAVVDSSLLTQIPQLWIFITTMAQHFFSLSFLFLSLLLLSLQLLFLLLPLFCFCSLFVAILRYYSTHLPMILQPTPCSVLCRIIHNKKHHWHRIHILWIRLYLLSRLCHGLLLCHSKVIFVMQPMCSMNHWKPSTTSFSTLLPCTTKAPSTLFGSVCLVTPSLVDLERILEAIVLS